MAETTTHTGASAAAAVVDAVGGAARSAAERGARAERLAAGRELLAETAVGRSRLESLRAGARLAAERWNTDAGAACALAENSLARAAGAALTDALESRSESLSGWLAGARATTRQRASASVAERAALRLRAVCGAAAGSLESEAEAEALAWLESRGPGWLARLSKRAATAARSADTRQSGARLAAEALALAPEQSESESAESAADTLLRLSAAQRRRLAAAERASAASLSEPEAESLSTGAAESAARWLESLPPLCWSGADWLRFAIGLALLERALRPRSTAVALEQADAIAASRRAPHGTAEPLCYLRPERRTRAVGLAEPDALAALERASRVIGWSLAGESLESLSERLPTAEQRDVWDDVLRAADARSLSVADWLSASGSRSLPGHAEGADAERGVYVAERLRLIRHAQSAPAGALFAARRLSVTKLARKAGARSRAETETLRRAVRCQRCQRSSARGLLSVRLAQRLAALESERLSLSVSAQRAAGAAARWHVFAQSDLFAPDGALSLWSVQAGGWSAEHVRASERAAEALARAERAAERLAARGAAAAEAEPYRTDYRLSGSGSECQRCAAGSLSTAGERLSGALLENGWHGWLDWLEPLAEAPAPAGALRRVYRSGWLESGSLSMAEQRRRRAERRRAERRSLALAWSAGSVARWLAQHSAGDALSGALAGSLAQRPALLWSLPAVAGEPGSLALARSLRLALESGSQAAAAEAERLWLARCAAERAALSGALAAEAEAQRLSAAAGSAAAVLAQHYRWLAGMAGGAPAPAPAGGPGAGVGKAERLAAALESGSRWHGLSDRGWLSAEYRWRYRGLERRAYTSLSVTLARSGSDAERLARSTATGWRLAGAGTLAAEARWLAQRERWSVSVRGEAPAPAEPPAGARWLAEAERLAPLSERAAEARWLAQSAALSAQSYRAAAEALALAG